MDSRLQQLDLTTCDREPIHLPGSVQPFGFMLVVMPDMTIAGASDNAARFLGGEVDDLKRRRIDAVFSESAMQAIGRRLDYLSGADSNERIFGLPLQDGGAPFDIALHFSGPYLIVEAEPSERECEVHSGELVRLMLAKLRDTKGFDAFMQESARQMKMLTGFDRVMVYRFDHEGSGEVIAEAAAEGLETYLGLHYPASDIPKQARLLYQRNWLRIIADINAPAAALEARPPLSPLSLDLSLSVLRSVSPIHIEYLRNMGVRASMSVSILRDNNLWGLFACHHYAPRHIGFERRTAAELFGQMFSWVLESRERELDVAYEARAHSLQERLLEVEVTQGDNRDTIARLIEDLADIVDCDGVAVWTDGQATLRGETPSAEQVTALVRFLTRIAPGRVHATHEIARVFPEAAEYAGRAAGLLAVPISRSPRDCLIFFRREAARSVTWAGNPTKPVTIGPLGARLTPRKSFEAWQEVVRGQSKPWTASDLRIAESLRVTLLEVILQISEIAARERRAAQERQELMIAELNHRVRNILSLIRGLIQQSRGTAANVEDFASVLGGRIQALGRAHDQITRLNWAPAAFRMLLESEAGAYLGAKVDRIRLNGPDVALDPKAFSTMALVVHEMLTNSAKYGALCDSTGEVDIDWKLDLGSRLIIEWKEMGGPPVSPPSRRGFGTTIIERSIPFDLKGEAEINYELLGVSARFVIPSTYVQVAAAPMRAAAAPAASADRLSGTALIVEDNMIIALNAEVLLLEIGAQHVDTASTVKDALRLIERTRPNFALLDLNLGAESSIPVGRKLLEVGVPFVFATGYGDRAPLPEELSDVVVIQKPYTHDAIRAAVGKALAARASTP